MRRAVYRYQFDVAISLDDVEDSLNLTLLAAEALHGECEVQLVAPYHLDADHRTCTVDATTPVGCDFNRVLLGFLRREFGQTGFRVQAVNQAQPKAASAA